MVKFDIRVCFLSYRSEVVIKDITHSCRICNGFVIKLNWMRYCSCDIFNWDYNFDSFPSIFNVIPIIFKIFCIINLLCFITVEKRFLYNLYCSWKIAFVCESFLLMNFFNSLYLLTFLSGAYLFNAAFIVSRKLLLS